VRRLTAFAAELGSTVVAGMFEVSDDPERPFNTLAVVDADGLRASYRKIHLYDSFGYRESDRLSAGPVEPVLVDVDGIRVGLMTCYDLRFPELARELVARGAELLVAPSAWVAGAGKVHHWRTLVTARAIENTAYVAAVGQPGPRYTGHSLVVGPTGELVAEVGDGDHVLTASVSSEDLARARQENPSLLNRRF
jgi:predicted amidohydrolase